MDPINRLLFLCACVKSSPSRLGLIVHAAEEIPDWKDIPFRAEAQGLSPLLLKHLLDAGVEIPREQRREMKVLSLRQRYAHEVRFIALKEIIQAFNEAKIRVILLKGAALCHLLYPEPGLRPMSDLDILVDPAEILNAQKVLTSLEYFAPAFQESIEEHRHLPPATKEVQGFNISVELHHGLFDEETDLTLKQEELDFDTLYAEALPITAEDGNFRAFGLGYESMLYHLCRHLVDNNDGFGPLRMIWFADISGFAARYQGQIDWEHIQNRYPLVVNTLSIIGTLAPLPEELGGKIPMPSDRLPASPGEDYSGWPMVSLGRGRIKGYWSILTATFFPQEWWLRLRYGLGCSQSTAGSRVKHMLHILKLAAFHRG
jgi:hypothetical protein